MWTAAVLTGFTKLYLHRELGPAPYSLLLPACLAAARRQLCLGHQNEHDKGGENKQGTVMVLVYDFLADYLIAPTDEPSMTCLLYRSTVSSR